MRQEQVVSHLLGQSELWRLATGDETEVARGGLRKSLDQQHCRKDDKHYQVEANHQRDHRLKRAEAEETKS